MRIHRLGVALMSLSSLLVGCDPRVFDDIADEAPVVAMTPGSNYNGAFGKVVTATGGNVGGSVDVTRIVAGAGADSVQQAFSVWAASELVISTSRKYDICEDTDCSATGGAAMAGIPSWGMDNACVMVAAPATGVTRITCEDSLNVQTEIHPDPMTDQDAIGLGTSVAGIPEVGNPVGIGFLGAPDGNAGVGEMYRLRDLGSAYHLIDLSAAMLPANAELGIATATALLPDDGSVTALEMPVLLVAGAPGAGRVVLAALGDADPDPMVVTIQADVLGCLDSSEPGFGGVVAAGDITGDGIPEVVVSSDAATLGRVDVVQYYEISDLLLGAAAAVGCDGLPTTPADITAPDATMACPDGDLEDVACGGFGAALAIGDVNSPASGPLHGDLLVGAPFSSVDGYTRSGAGYLYPGSATGPELGAVDVLWHSNPGTEDQMGTSVTMVGTQLNLTSAGARSEPALGAPGADAVYVFLCSELTGDTSDNGDRCVASD